MDFLPSMMALTHKPVTEAINECYDIMRKQLVAKEALCAKYRELLGVSGENRVRTFLKDIAVNWHEFMCEYIDECNAIMAGGIHFIPECDVNFDLVPPSHEMTTLITILNFVGRKSYVSEIKQISSMRESNLAIIMMHSAPLPPEIPREAEGALNDNSESLLNEMKDRYFNLFKLYKKARHITAYINKLQWQAEALALLPSSPLNDQVKGIMVERKEQLMNILRDLSSTA